jgi:peptide methionine sulfoxide reductase msrA/msrB
MNKLFALAAVLILLITGCQRADSSQQGAVGSMTQGNETLCVATFAGGCFWCVEADFEKVAGVVKAVSGYTGAKKENPTYEEVSSGKTGHVEAVQVSYDPAKVTYEELLQYFWRHMDPTDPGGNLSIGVPSTGASSSITMRSRRNWRESRRKSSANPESSVSRLLRRS